MNKTKDNINNNKGERISRAAITALVLALIMVANVILYMIVEMFDMYLHKEYYEDLSISGSTDEYFADAVERAKIDGNKVKISFCLTEDKVKIHETGSFVYTTAKNFEKRYPDLIDLDFINVITMRNEDGELVDDLDKYETDMYGNETKMYNTSVIFEYGTNYRVVTDTYTSAGFAPFFTLNSEGQATAYNGEEVMAGMIGWVLAEEHKVAYFTQYHGEIADLAFSNLLGTAGYYVDVVDLRKSEIPENADLVVISNPQSDFEKAADGASVRSEIDRLNSYMERGGNLFVGLDPYVKNLPVLEGFLAEWGIEFEKTGDRNLRELIKDSDNAITTDGFTLVTDYAKSDIAKKISAKVGKYSDGNVIVSNAAVLSCKGNAEPILISSPSSVAEANGKTVSEKGSYCIAAGSERDFDGKSAKLFVVSSIYLAVSDSLVSKGYSNRDFIYSVLEDFLGAGKMPYGSNVSLYDTTTLQNLKLGTARAYTVAILAIPVLFAVAGTVIIIRRKNR